MFLICRKVSEGPINIICRGDCESFVKHYVKFNLDERGRSETSILRTEEIPIETFMDSETDSETKDNVTTEDCGCDG
jgi:hypothetical protein